jgi:hypothetical protein
LKKSKLLILFFGILSIGLLPAYVFQKYLYTADQQLNPDITYIFNLLFTIPFISIIIFGIEKLKQHIGYIFLGIGILKILVFLIFIKLNAVEVSRDNFLLFFIPYVVCMIAEVFVLSKYLNNADF